ncbi:MAG: endonuclease III [Bdellovibrionales bacterium]
MARESKSAKELRTRRVLRLLKRHYPDAHCALNHQTPEQLLVATVLSAQCTDERVNMVTPALFGRFPDMKSLSAAKVEDIEELIRSTGFFRNKAKNLKGLATELCEKHQGQVPADLDVLVNLPGVGRKTANVVLGNSFGLATGVVVDTHVQRLSTRLGLTTAKQPVPIERDLMALVPKVDWVQFSHWLITHGRQVCKARKPMCDKCFLADDCPQNRG